MPKEKAKEPSLDLCKRFENGLKEKHGMTIEQLETQNWKNCGGNKGGYKKYYKMCFPKTKLPEPVDKCVCGTKIKELHYITPNNKSAMLTIGKCCKLHFLRKEVCGRTCEKCDKPHKNRKDNRCNSCRILWHKCADCDKEIKDYARCFNCNKSHKKEKLDKEIERKRKEREAKDKREENRKKRDSRNSCDNCGISIFNKNFTNCSPCHKIIKERNQPLIKEIKNDSEYLLEKQKIKDFEKSQIKYLEISDEKKDKNNIRDFFKKKNIYKSETTTCIPPEGRLNTETTLVTPTK
tara:strand:+ start:2493 stop:3371 length:879 start_codon:yes stop_codon:yes gene_type:complete